MKISKLIFIFFLILSEGAFCKESRVVLVTGGAGYIGSHACKALKEAGFTPVTYDSLDLGVKESVKWGPLIVGDLLEVEKLERVFSEYNPIAVLHFAALRNVGESVNNPSIYYTNNVMGSINLLNTMLKYDVKNIVFSSSCTVYGVTGSGPIDENRLRSPINPYAMTKYTVERMIEDYAHAYDFKYVVLRYFNAAGVDLSSGLKRSIYSHSFLIPTALLAVLNPMNPLKIFGFDYPTFDGSAIRDYIHVKDLAEAHVLALGHLEAGKGNESINLGTGNGLSVFEIVSAIERITGQRVPQIVMNRRDGDVPEAIADAKKSKEILNFVPHYSDLDEIIQSEWVSIQPGYN